MFVLWVVDSCEGLSGSGISPGRVSCLVAGGSAGTLFLRCSAWLGGVFEWRCCLVSRVAAG